MAGRAEVAQEVAKEVAMAVAMAAAARAAATALEAAKVVAAMAEEMEAVAKAVVRVEAAREASTWGAASSWRRGSRCQGGVPRGASRCLDLARAVTSSWRAARSAAC